MLPICDMRQTALLPLWRKACCGFFSPEKSDGFGEVWGLNPRSWVPEASMLTTRLPKPQPCDNIPNCYTSWQLVYNLQRPKAYLWRDGNAMKLCYSIQLWCAYNQFQTRSLHTRPRFQTTWPIHLHVAALSKNWMIHAVYSRSQLTESNGRYLHVASIKGKNKYFHIQFDMW
jgi:hypothetical protein